MAEKYDVILIGGGHNGLTVAAYLLKAGLKVCVLERQDKVGGGVITREVTLPGFKHDPASLMHGLVVANPIIHQDELGLVSKYGLKYLYPDVPFAIIFPDDRALVFDRSLDKTCESIAQFSQKDAETYRKFNKAAVDMRKVAQIGMFSPPPPWGTMMSILSASDAGREFLRVILSSANDVADDWFESNHVRIGMGRFASEIMVGPREKGTGNAMWFVAGLHSWGMAVPVGGSGSLSEALEKCIKGFGGTIKVNSPVKSVKMKDGVAIGVVLESGEEIQATRGVVSNVNVKQLFLEMVAADVLPAGFRDKVARLKPSSFSGLKQDLALDRAPQFKAGPRVDGALYVEYSSDDPEAFGRAFDDYCYGIPNTKMPMMSVTSLIDPTRAPPGKHTMYLWHYEPYHLKDGGADKWDVIRQKVADDILETTFAHMTNMSKANVLGRWIMSPRDMPRNFPSMLEGDLGHIAHFLTQFFANRPIPGWGHYKTPVSKLYMCGASTYPGQGVTCGGRAAVQAIMEDLGIDFRKVVKK